MYAHNVPNGIVQIILDEYKSSARTLHASSFSRPLSFSFIRSFEHVR